MRSILVVERKHLFPGLSPQGFLPRSAVDLDVLQPRMFFAERAHMEQDSHYKQIIPYLVLTRGEGADTHVLCYQRLARHTERRLGGLWSVGFGGHIEPLDRDDPDIAEQGLLRVSALRELVEETGLRVDGQDLSPAGYINSDREDVSSVHFGVVFRIRLDSLDGDDEALLATVMAQAEPHQARWVPAAHLPGMTCPGDGPNGGSFEDWSRIAVEGLFG
ncbi:NUDIX domain-containing protein [bacterium]|nr:NUDIX domain-containing protein [bacterium]MBU1072073.1 NUDIX domain-containing protein [bacterium]MBU1675888.1 NUDIX domain-containing protein [bacterium]